MRNNNNHLLPLAAVLAVIILPCVAVAKNFGHGATWGAGLVEETIEADVFVAGGGSAGTSAAIAAARNGARTVLVDGRTSLGGNSGSEIRVTMVGACGPRSGSGDDNRFKLDCREGGIVEEYILENNNHNPDHVASLFSLELYTLIKAEPNLTLLQNTWLVGVDTSNVTDGPATITTAYCEDQGSQRRYIVKAKAFIDATGDGRLGAEAGAEWTQGREGKSEYNESLAMDFADNETEGTSILYAVADMGEPRSFDPPFWAKKFNVSEFRYRSVGGQVPIGYWWNEVSWPYNTVIDGEAIKNEGIANAFGIWDYIKNSGDHPESANMGISWIGQVGGKREARRFRGQYVMSQNDIVSNITPGQRNYGPNPQQPTLFWDRVAYSGWDFDLHNPWGMYDPEHPPFNSTLPPYMFSTPLRSLISKDLTNLFFAGRLASFTHVVFGSQRVMKTCATQGQAAGTAAAYAVTHGVDPINLQNSKPSVWSIQQQLIRDDAFVIGIYNEDPRDYALKATVSATSEYVGSGMDGRAMNIISGQNRAVIAPRGVAPSQGLNGTNRWISTEVPATLTLKLPSAAPLAQIQLTFDTGMHRRLSMSPVNNDGDSPTKWGAQIETVRDYVIEGTLANGSTVVLCNVTGNYQRRRVHSLPCSEHPNPRPTPAPAPAPAIAPGAISAGLCTASSSQLWTITSDNRITVNSTTGLLCLGYSDNTSAFGGRGKAVVALPCSSSSPSWQFEPVAGTTAKMLSLVKPAPCSFGGICDAKLATSMTVAGAGNASANGVYGKTSKTSDGYPVFQKDASHQLYRYGGVWKIADMGDAAYYTSTQYPNSEGPPAANSGWSIGPLGVAPSPSLITCQGASPESCACVHPVACAACHPTGTNGQVYYPGTSVELERCDSSISHIQFLELSIKDGPSSAGMLMTDGLCLSVEGNSTVASPKPPSLRRIPPRPRFEVREALLLQSVSVNVVSTNGYEAAIINEIRLYDTEGVSPFPKQN